MLFEQSPLFLSNFWGEEAHVINHVSARAAPWLSGVILGSHNLGYKKTRSRVPLVFIHVLKPRCGYLL
jgi:hypothetical protein